MPAQLPPLCLTRARILREGYFSDQPLTLAGGLLTEGGGTEVDLAGYAVLPGIIDLHGDGFEHHVFPRPSAPFPLWAGLASYDREAATHGVTTTYLAQGWSWEGGHRGPDHAEALLLALEEHRPKSLIEQRVQLRAETHFIEAADRLMAAVRRFDLGYVVFNDHLEEGLTMSRQQPEAFGLWARKLGVGAETLLARLKAAKACAKAVPRTLCQLADAFEQRGVRFGSHDDPDAETREFFSMIGARIAEFPISRRAAAAARAMGDPVIMGAPNVVRGGSQSGNIAAVDLIRDGLCDALVSDYHLPALPLAIWTLVDLGVLDLAKGWQMISTAPARILGLHDRGRIAAGLRADLVVMNEESRQIEAVICGGRLVFACGEAALRLMQPGQPMRLAAE
ncbi:alpha-D-ribose 1-methylphosphonate 5-triphosphate diphosphatase [Pseudotabrizicola sp. L79]|uniref:alpha-D-ribose 1-methylphosphonate 5-triphosphate diphosphatase n=1 Tax=Pseudotabrizicola sp. L79 TaxID=3118402 RepID=UPI002F944CBB